MPIRNRGHTSMSNLRTKFTTTPITGQKPFSLCGKRVRSLLLQIRTYLTCNSYREVNTCEEHIIPDFGLPPFESDDRLGSIGQYLNPFTSPMIFNKRGTPKPEACKNPDILPVRVVNDCVWF